MVQVICRNISSYRCACGLAISPEHATALLLFVFFLDVTIDRIIAGTADVIVIEDNCSSDVFSTAPGDGIVPSASAAMVIVGSPCPAAAAATISRSGSRPCILSPRYRCAPPNHSGLCLPFVLQYHR
jgi:hypothetical protein